MLIEWRKTVGSRRCREIVVEGHRRGRPLKSWDEAIRGDLRMLNIQHHVTQDRVNKMDVCYQANPSNPCKHGNRR